MGAFLTRLHAQVRSQSVTRGGRELIALDDAEIKYSTAQNWYMVMKAQGGIGNFAKCAVRGSNPILDQVETGSAIT
jgi:hypothetical protein